jgi:hypothetical protein
MTSMINVLITEAKKGRENQKGVLDMINKISQLTSEEFLILAQKEVNREA